MTLALVYARTNKQGKPYLVGRVGTAKFREPHGEPRPFIGVKLA